MKMNVDMSGYLRILNNVKPVLKRLYDDGHIDDDQDTDINNVMWIAEEMAKYFLKEDDESKRQPPDAPTGDKAECINLADQARDLIDFLQTDGCLDCDEYSTLLNVVDTMQAYIENSQPNAWIACSERLPEPDEKVLIYREDGRISQDWWDSRRNMWFFAGLGCDMFPPATHWQALPQPPAGKAGE